MDLVEHFDHELHQMDVKTGFINGEIDGTIYIGQPEIFVLGDLKNIVYSLKIHLRTQAGFSSVALQISLDSFLILFKDKCC